MFVASEYDDAPPAELGWEGRINIPGPIYPLERVVALAQEASRVNLWTRGSIQRAQALHGTSAIQFGSDTEYIASLLVELGVNGIYLKSEWCDNGKNAVAACDSYQLVRREWAAGLGKFISVKYYLKFALSRAGNLILVVSNHV